MKQIARNVTTEGCGFLRDCRHLLHDRDTKCTHIRAIIKSGSGGAACAACTQPEPPMRRVGYGSKEECLSTVILPVRRELVAAGAQRIRRPLSCRPQPSGQGQHPALPADPAMIVSSRSNASSVRKAVARLDDLAQGPVQRLDRIGRVRAFADARGKREERHNVVPGPPPAADRGIAFAPFGLQLLKPHKRDVRGLGPVDRLDGGQDRLAVLPRHECQAAADQMNDAGLHRGLRERRPDRPRKPLKPSTTAIKMSLTHGL